MSNMRPKNSKRKDSQAQVIAVIASDIHLRMKAPPYRAEKDHWLDVQANYLNQLLKLGQNYGSVFIYPGDIFDRWNSPPELINFALKYLPRGFAIPGQHDLPYHNYRDRRKSAYWTLVEAGLIEDLPPYEERHASSKLTLFGFPYGFPLRSLDHYEMEVADDQKIRLAVVHDYVWTMDNKYEGAPRIHYYGEKWKNLKGYVGGVFGDNHKGFTKINRHGQFIFNCGGFMCLHSDQKDYKPGVGLLYSDGKIERHFLDCDKDEWIEPDDPRPPEVKRTVDLESFLEMMSDLGEVTLNFKDAINHYMRKNKQSKEVTDLVFKSLDKK